MSYPAIPVSRVPNADRYASPVAIGLILVLASSFAGAFPSRRALLVIFAVVAFALPVNLWQMREYGAYIRTESNLTKARLSIVELEREATSSESGASVGVPVLAGPAFHALPESPTI